MYKEAPAQVGGITESCMGSVREAEKAVREFSTDKRLFSVAKTQLEASRENCRSSALAYCSPRSPSIKKLCADLASEPSVLR
jgi:hypothetical protein